MVRNPAPVNRGNNQDGSEFEAPVEIHLPELPSAAFGNLLEFFYLSGQCIQTGSGLVPLTWTEIKNFREENDLDMMVWEREILKKMSEAYCGEYARASDPKRPNPYSPVKEEQEEDEANLAKALQFRQILKGFRKEKV